MSIREIPVLLLTGYLGSGKTTLVNKILSNKQGIKFAVIVNDIGEVNIDADLIEKGGVVGKKDEISPVCANSTISSSRPVASASLLLSRAPSARFPPWASNM